MLTGIFPGNIQLYKQAFRHASAAREIAPGVKDSYERLEFLGDAVLGTIVGHYFYKKFPFKDEGFLTRMRSRMVSREFLSRLALKLNLHKLIEKKGEPGQQISGDILEALIGAIYIDKGFTRTNDFVLQHIMQHYIDMDDLVNTEIDYKSKIIEKAQKEKIMLHFETTECSSDERGRKSYCSIMQLNGVKVAEGFGASKKKAEQDAARCYYTQTNTAE